MITRRGSILVTSVGMIGLFMAGVVGAIAFVGNRSGGAQNDKLRLLAEQAAKTGMEFVLGWAEGSIDKETKLPKSWDSMNDGQILDPVKQHSPAGVTEFTNVRAVSAAGVGGLLGPTDVKEYVLGSVRDSNGNAAYVVSFKARVQQFRVSEDMPRQFKVGVIGRVRKAGRNDPAVDGNEQGTIVAERVMLSYIGKEPVTRYAALIDTDQVRNWVPGEVTDGPVHINRGYVDLHAPTQGCGYRDRNVMINNANYLDSQIVTKMRSAMMLYVSGTAYKSGNPGFTLANKTTGKNQSISIVGYPVFKDVVSVTEMNDGSGPLNDDPINGKPWSVMLNGAQYYTGEHPAVNALSTYIFPAPENQNVTRYGSASIAGPVVRKQPVELPRSVRNRLLSAMGMPAGTSTNYSFLLDERAAGTHPHTIAGQGLENGVYLPTVNFWNSGQANAYGGTPVAGPNNVNYATGGIYIRGTVELMRMAVEDKYSIYMFRLGRGGSNLRTSMTSDYVVIANRSVDPADSQAGFIWLKRLGPGGLDASVSTGTGAKGGWKKDANNKPSFVQALMGGALPTTSSTADMFQFRQAAGAGKPVAVLGPGPGRTYPFNGVIFVDADYRDDTRWVPGKLPLTGHILALGDTGVAKGKHAKTAINGSDDELFITAQYDPNRTNPTDPGRILTPVNLSGKTSVKGGGKGGSPTIGTMNVGTPASRLSIQCVGNVFIQNDLISVGIRHYQPDVDINPVKPSLLQTKDLLGIVSDRQILMGLMAGRGLSKRAGVDLEIHGSMAALGDPSQPYSSTDVWPADVKVDHKAYAGSVGVEGLMMYYNQAEDYNIYDDNDLTKTPNSAQRHATKATQMAQFGYPANPVYETYGLTDIIKVNNNPNGQIRGNLRVFGSVTQKRRGIVGRGDLSFDKDFVFDRRLLTLAPPIFPASTNMVVRSQSPFAPDPLDANKRLYYRGGTAPVGNSTDALAFMYGRGID